MIPSVLFVCLGNICRSPLAEVALRAEAAAQRFDLVIDSAGTGNWHVGEPPDSRAQAVAMKNGVDASALRARQVMRGDFTRFTHIVAMDSDNLADLRRLMPDNATAELSLLLDHVPGREGQSVADPYYGDDDGFDVTWAEAVSGAQGLITRIRSA